MKMPEPICLDCTHCEAVEIVPGHIIEDAPRCRSPKNEWLSLVTGTPRTCFVTRYLGGCGAAGQWFEPKKA